MSGPEGRASLEEAGDRIWAAARAAQERGVALVTGYTHLQLGGLDCRCALGCLEEIASGSPYYDLAARELGWLADESAAFSAGFDSMMPAEVLAEARLVPFYSLGKKISAEFGPLSGSQLIWSFDWFQRQLKQGGEA